MTNPIQKPYVLDASKYVWVKVMGQWVLFLRVNYFFVDTRAYLSSVNAVYCEPKVWTKYNSWQGDYGFFDCDKEAMHVAECAVAMGDDTAPVEEYRSLSEYNLENYFENLSSL